MDDSKVTQAIKHIEEGNSLRSAAREVGENPSLLKYYIDKRAIGIKSKKKGRERKWDFQKAWEMREQGMNCTQIGDVLKVSANTLRKAFSRFMKNENF